MVFKIMAEVTKEAVGDALRNVKTIDGDQNIVDAGLVSEIVLAGKNVMFAISVGDNAPDVMEPVRKQAEAAVQNLSGVGKVMAALTGEAGSGAATKRPAPARQPTHESAPAKPAGIPGVRNIIAVASGKGGVGKSTTSVNLALGLASLGLKIGILDADIYGPSIPRLLALTSRPEPVSPGSRILKPIQGYGLSAMSIGFMVEEDTPVIWRGPMVMSALRQMLQEVAWNDLDVLVVDMPPGTGDAQLTMAQQTPLAGAVIVSTPQDLALIDARKGLNMFRRVEVPVLGIVENMSYFICSNCGERHEIFGHGGARKEAEKLGVPFLGEVPLDVDVRHRSDAGLPIVATAPDSPHAEIYRAIAGQVWAALEGTGAGPLKRSAPKIVIE